MVLVKSILPHHFFGFALVRYAYEDNERISTDGFLPSTYTPLQREGELVQLTKSLQFAPEEQEEIVFS